MVQDLTTWCGVGENVQNLESESAIFFDGNYDFDNFEDFIVLFDLQDYNNNQ